MEEKRRGEEESREGGREGVLVKGKKVDLVLKKMVRQGGSSLEWGRGGGSERGNTETRNS